MLTATPARAIPESDVVATSLGITSPGAQRLPNISVVIPVYRSERSLPPLVARLAGVLPTVAEQFEVILVDDRSPDGSWEVVRALVDEHPFVRGIGLMRNFGQHNALLCGIRAARHEIVVTMDDDLQHPPEEIVHLLRRLDAGDADVVYGLPRELPHSLWRNLASKYTKLAMARAMGLSNVGQVNAFRAFRTQLRAAFSDYHSPALLLDVLLSWGTTRFAAVTVRHEPRTIGQSGYTVRKLVNQAMLMLTGFSTAPLRLASYLGFACAGFGTLVLVYVVAAYFIRGSVPGFTFLAAIVSVFSGAQLFAIGIIGEYIARIFGRSMERPTYVERERLGA